MVRATAFSLVLLASALAAGGEPPLTRETSPYLREHAADDAGWLPWGDAAFDRARREGKLVLLLVGRWGCHACREREAVYAEPPVATLVGKRFVPVLVDRDERPDVAVVYAGAAMLLSPEAAGGEPLVAALTSEGRPVHAALARGDPGAGAVLEARLAALADRYDRDRSGVELEAGRTAAQLREGEAGAPSRGALGADAVRKPLAGLREAFDTAHGGFGAGPKAPPHAALRLLLEEHQRAGDAEALRMVTRTLDALARSALRDALGGGFHREAADAEWRLPRFEKTLADNALLLRSYARAYAATESPVYRAAAEGIVRWARRELADPAGGFRAGLDADSEGQEGRFYLWTPEEIVEALGAEKGASFLGAYCIDPPGVLAEAGAPVVGALPKPLLERRAARVPPAVDDRVMSGANGLMIGALAICGTVFDEPDDVAAAKAAADAVLARLGPPGALRRCVRGTQPCGPAVLEDYAFLIEGLLDLHEATREARWRDAALALTDAVLARFLDVERGGFFATDGVHEPLLVRIKDGFDGPLPSANGVMASALLRLGRETGQKRYADLARRTVEAFLGDLVRAPRGMESLAAAAGELLGKEETGAPQTAGDPLPARVAKGPVTVEAALSSASVRAGELVEARVRVKVAKGWCVTAHRPMARDLTGLAVSLPGDFMVAGPARYPDGIAVRGPFTKEPIAAVYFDEAEVVVPLRVPPRASPGLEHVRLRVRYQPCDERSCKAPEGALLEVPLTVTAR